MSIPHMHQHTMDWRASLSKNTRRTRWVMLFFFLIYAVLGLLCDVAYLAPQMPHVPIEIIFQALITFRIIPWFMFIALGVAGFCLWITLCFHHRLMLLGTESIEVTAHESDPQKQLLFNVIEEMKIAAGMPYMPRIYIIQADYMNAFASGYSEQSAMIAITQGLLEKLDRDELKAVMAHELSHIRHGDIKLTLVASVLSNLILMLVDFLFYGFVYSNDDRDNNRGGLLAAILILRFTLPLITMALLLFLSRTREYMADAGCVELMRDNEPLARALMKIHHDSLANKDHYGKAYRRTKHESLRREAYIFDPVQAHIQPAASPSDWFSTHPGLIKRLAALGFKQGN